MQSFIPTRKLTASRPSMMRWLQLTVKYIAGRGLDRAVGYDRYALPRSDTHCAASSLAS